MVWNLSAATEPRVVSSLLNHTRMEMWTITTTENDLHKKWQRMCEYTSGICQFPNF